MKQCTNCKRSKESNEFQKRSSSVDGLSSRCRKCLSKWYRNEYKTNPNRRILLRKKMKEHQANFRAHVKKAKSVPCKDCDKNFPAVAMDFDHMEGFEKLDDICRLIKQNVSLETLNKEINKCEIVCAVCHRIRTEFRRTKIVPS